jgi:hypothetical protein
MQRFRQKFGLSEDAVWEFVDDFTFTNYHVFRSESRILSGDAADPNASPPATPPTKSTPAPPAKPPQ